MGFNSGFKGLTPNFLKISSTYKSDTNAMNIDIVLFGAWLALQSWRLRRMVFPEIQHSNISPSSPLPITYTRIRICISELEGDRNLQPNSLHGKTELKYEEFFSFPTNFE